jgi:hypothetical protein
MISSEMMSSEYRRLVPDYEGNLAGGSGIMAEPAGQRHRRTRKPAAAARRSISRIGS